MLRKYITSLGSILQREWPVPDLRLLVVDVGCDTSFKSPGAHSCLVKSPKLGTADSIAAHREVDFVNTFCFKRVRKGGHSSPTSKISDRHVADSLSGHSQWQLPVNDLPTSQYDKGDRQQFFVLSRNRLRRETV